MLNLLSLQRIVTRKHVSMSLQMSLVDVVLEYCAPCGYTPQALGLTEEILNDRELEYYIRSWQLIPASNGVFELTVNGELLYSKKALGRHAEAGECKRLIADAIARAKVAAGIE